MFDFLGDIARGVGSVIGAVTGTIIGVPVHIIAQGLGITKDMVQEAINEGCTTYEEVKDFFDL